MRILFLLFAAFLFLFQVVPGNAQAPTDTMDCVHNGGSCNFVACSPPSQHIGTCRSGTLNCCKWPRPSTA